MKHIVRIKHIMILFNLEATLPLLCGGSIYKGDLIKQKISQEENQKSAL